MPKPATLPDTFEERCPMCQHEGLTWGFSGIQGAWGKYTLVFEPDHQMKPYKLRRFDRAAAECPRCGYLMLFNRKWKN